MEDVRWLLGYPVCPKCHTIMKMKERPCVDTHIFYCRCGFQY
ncbi:MAG: hypothetical protein ACOCRK_06365 [bacterium]